MKKKVLMVIVGIMLVVTGICYAGETLTAQQQEAQKWFKQAENVDTPKLKRIEYFTKAIELDPKYADAYYGRGDVYERLGEYQEAIDDYSRVIELHSKDACWAYYGRGDVYKKLGEYQEAIDDYTGAIELFPEDAYTFGLSGAYYSRGWAYYNLGKYQRAINDYTRIIKLHSEDVYPFYDCGPAYYSRGWAYYNLGEYQKAIDGYSRVIELHSKDADAYYSRGLAYFIQKFPTTACDDLYQAGILYLKQNNRTQALKCVDLMKEVDPSSPLIKKLMDKIYKVNKELKAK